ncbi:hypothetical protein GIB67_036580 [Kingdonia uniflora]|uniref:Fungal lipase-type domain-containing protein n=1 Tax=Kingdonia uniflora TaxID=39325 RepID=A0A7J7MEQ4_9MAGN|nr:hypothetical protein GIB67_036580 [Kingdonia uniflora]
MRERGVVFLGRVVDFRDSSISQLKKQETYRQFVYSVLTRCQSQWSKADNAEADSTPKGKNFSEKPIISKDVRHQNGHESLSKYSFNDDNDKWKVELAWLSKALEPALQLYKWALPAENGDRKRAPPSTRSLSQIVDFIQQNNTGIRDWSLGDLTVGLYLIYLRQASSEEVEHVKGVQIVSDSIVQDLIYHTELAKGAYKEHAAGLARNSMLREQNILKFVKSSSVMRPGYYIGTDTRNKFVILGIRGTHTIYDLITDIVSSNDREITLEGFSTHFGTTEAARWFLHHEMGTIKKCLEKHEGFRLRLVGHSLGGAAASLLAIMLRKKSQEELGFSPEIVSAVGFGTPPCVSKELAESCSSFVSTVVMQDDIIPRLSAASLKRLRNEVLQTDCPENSESPEPKPDLNNFVKRHVYVINNINNPSNAHLTVHCKSRDNDLGVHNLAVNFFTTWSFREDVLLETRFWCEMSFNDLGVVRHGTFDVYGQSFHNKFNNWSVRRNGLYYSSGDSGGGTTQLKMAVLEKEDWKSVVDMVANAKQVVSSVQDVARKLADYANFTSKTDASSNELTRKDFKVLDEKYSCEVPKELFVPGTLYFVKRDVNNSSCSNAPDSYTLWKRQPGEHFQRILLSSNMYSDHKCDSHLYALRDVLKGLPRSANHTDLYG